MKKLALTLIVVLLAFVGGVTYYWLNMRYSMPETSLAVETNPLESADSTPAERARVPSKIALNVSDQDVAVKLMSPHMEATSRLLNHQIEELEAEIADLLERQDITKAEINQLMNRSGQVDDNITRIEGEIDGLTP